MLQENVERYRKEIASLRETEQKMAAAAQKHEQTIHTLNEDLRAAKEKLTMSEVLIRTSIFFLFLCCLFLSLSSLHFIVTFSGEESKSHLDLPPSFS